MSVFTVEAGRTPFSPAEGIGRQKMGRVDTGYRELVGFTGWTRTKCAESSFFALLAGAGRGKYQGGAKGMAKAGNRVKITLRCKECKQRNYNTKKNKKNTPDRLERNKYCPFCKKHTLHTETK